MLFLSTDLRERIVALALRGQSICQIGRNLTVAKSTVVYVYCKCNNLQRNGKFNRSR